MSKLRKRQSFHEGECLPHKALSALFGVRKGQIFFYEIMVMRDDSCLFFNILILQQEEVVNQMQMSVLTLKKFLLVKEMKSGTLHPGALLTHHEQWRRFH